ncbi:hypothetical protein F3F51_10295 [Bacteroides ovatus]|uniref:Uncharacterized protein n=1 Tax=Bacteroides ovatus TaxID=28116 RepID=A0A6N3V9X8_BACOV|nr:hypothetical protein F3F51_10295 [Bacteroides ovatus]
MTSGYFLFLGRALHFIASRMRRYISVLFLGSLSPACFYFFRRSVPYGISILKVQGRQSALIIRKSKFPQNPKRSVRFSGKRTKRSVQKRKARNTQKAETKVL